MKTLTDEDWNVIKQVLGAVEVQNLIGSERWSLSEDAETLLWVIIKREGLAQ